MLGRTAVALLFLCISSSSGRPYNNKKKQCDTSADCRNKNYNNGKSNSYSRLCLDRECVRVYRPELDCYNRDEKCPDRYCCMVQLSRSTNSGYSGICVKSSSVTLQQDQLCSRSCNSNYCQCGTNLACVKDSQSFLPIIPFTCQSNDFISSQECTENHHCKLDQCCSTSSKQCKSRMGVGDKCWPHGDYPESFLSCAGYCVLGAECQRNKQIYNDNNSNNKRYYTCQNTTDTSPPTCE